MPGSEGLARSTTVDVDGSLAEALWHETVQKIGEKADARETIRPRGPTLPAEPASTVPPSLPGYELLDELGQGGMGVVYRAREESLRREVAVKLIRSGTGGAEARDRFLAEARTTAALDHPNIVPVHELGETPEGQLYLGMKLVSGSSWRALLHPGADSGANDAERELAKGYGLERHLRVLLSVMNAVAFAHRKGIIHRDLKPENVMVGEFGEVLVMDWGLAVAFEDGVASAHHRSTITDLAGSPAYMSPELAEVRTRELGPATDVYLLGAILHEVLVGRPPHQGERLVDVLRAAARSESPAFAPDVPAELAAIATRALAREPAQRFASVRDMQAALEGYLEHRESARIAADARARLATAPPGGRERYDALAEAIAGFHQARLLWDGNEDARRGEEEARLAYARAALESNDLALAEAQVARLSPELPAGRELAASVREAVALRERARRTALALRAFAVGSVLAMVGGLAIGIWLVSNERYAALAARDSEARARADAEQQRALAEERLRGQNRNLARVYLEKGLRAGSGQDLLAAEVLFARSLELDPVPATRELVASVRLRGASQAWRCPDPAPIRDLCWSPDGAALAIAHVDSYGSMLRVWDVAALRGSSAPPSSACRFEVHTLEPLGALAWSRDGAELAAWCQRGDLVRWNAATGAFVSSVTRPADAVSLQWSPTLGRFASLGRNRMLGIRDASGALIRAFSLARPGGAFAWDPSGRLLAAIDGHALRLVEVEGGDVRELAADVEGVALAWTPRGDRLAVADGAESVRVFDTKDGVELPRLVTPRAGAGLLAWNHDGSLLAVAGRRGGIRVYDPASGELRLGVGADDWQYTPFAWRPGTDALALDENGVRVVALEGRGEHRTVARRLGRVAGLGFRSGNVLALDTEGTLHRLSLDGREVAREAGVRRLTSISPDGRHALRHLGATSEVWALEGKPERRFAVSGGFHAWRKDGHVLATAGTQDVSLWDVPSGERRARIVAPESPSLALSPDGRWLARASFEPARSMSVVLHDLASGATRAVVPPTAATFRGLAFSPDGARLAFLEQPHAAPECRLRILETGSGVERTLVLPASGVNPALLWGDARTVVVMSGRVVRLVDAATGDVRLEFRVTDAGSPTTPALAASEDGAWIAAGVSDVDIYDWTALLGVAGATPAELLAEAERRTGLRVEDDRLVPR